MEDLAKRGRTAERQATADATKRRRLELTVAQVAASALAAVVGAVLASELGVYGTIGGAAVVSVGATVGGAFFQHLFRRTGEQFRELSSGPVPVRTASPEAEFDPFDPGGEHTRMMARIAPPDPAESVTVYQGRRRLRPRNWKVLALSSVLVFAVAMGTVTAAELVAGKPMADVVRNTSGSGTTFGGGSSSTRQQVSTTPTTTPTAAPGDGASHASGGEQQNSSSGAVTSPGSGPSPTGASTSPGPTPATGTPSPSASAGTQSPQARPTPSATPSP